MNELKLEAGKRYITRGGVITPPLVKSGDNKPYPWVCGGLSWSKYGKNYHDTSSIHPLDIVAEYHEPAPAGWILCSDRMPTEADGCQGCTRDDEEGCVLWMTLEMGLYARKWNDPPVAVAVVAWLPIPKFTPPAPEPKLPDPPPGRQWHKPDALTPEMLREGWRPLLVGERKAANDEWTCPAAWEPCANFVPVEPQHAALRTKRPLPAPEPVRIPLGPADIPPGSVLRVTGSPGWNGISAVSSIGVIVAGRVSETSFDAVRKKGWEITRDNGQTWEPCWKEGGAA